MRRYILSGCAIAALVASTAAIASETVTYTYDARGRLKVVAHSGGPSNGKSTSYSYDRENFRPLGLQLFLEKVRPAPKANSIFLSLHPLCFYLPPHLPLISSGPCTQFLVLLSYNASVLAGCQRPVGLVDLIERVLVNARPRVHDGRGRPQNAEPS